MTVCSGAWILASTGFLNGKKATTSKMFYKKIVVRLNLGGTVMYWKTLTFTPKAATDKSIQWVPKARWVVDGNAWTGAGGAAGAHYKSTLV